MCKPHHRVNATSAIQRLALYIGRHIAIAIVIAVAVAIAIAIAVAVAIAIAMAIVWRCCKELRFTAIATATATVTSDCKGDGESVCDVSADAKCQP
jgi:uncharacterized membrane protein YjgN (DUF898 family)